MALSQSAIADARGGSPSFVSSLTPDRIATLKPGDTFQECEACPQMVVAPPGSFTMGSNKGNRDEKPVHQVTISYAFAAGKFEITVAEYETCIKDRACDQPQWRKRGSYYHIQTGSDAHYKKMGTALTDPRHPIVGISWINAKQYIAWLNDKVAGAPYRLLSEAEWEYLARGGTGQRTYWWGDRFNAYYANSARIRRGDSWPFTSPVGTFPANPFGLHDLHGNVWEWVEDCHTASYAGAPGDGSAHISEDCGRRVLRGGSWFYVPRLLRSADRFGLPFVNRLNDIGFRVARTLR